MPMVQIQKIAILDVRGVALNSKQEILTNHIEFDQYVDAHTDTRIYGIFKFFDLLKESNPNMLEILGCRKEKILYVHPLAQLLLDHKEIFLSKHTADTFAGYANAQFNRYLNKNARFQSKEEHEKRLLFSLEKAMKNLSKSAKVDMNDVCIYVDSEGLCMDLNLKQVKGKNTLCI